MDRMHFKGGRYRPWLILGSVTCAVGLTLFFTKFNISMKLYLIVFPLCYLIAYRGYNFMWVAYCALMGLIGKNHKDSVSLTTAAGQLGTASMLIFSVIGVKYYIALPISLRVTHCQQSSMAI